MKITLLRKHPGTGNAFVEEYDDVEKALAASDVFPYWALWFPEDTDGKLKVQFFHMDYVIEVSMLGEKEEQKLASVTELKPKGGDNFGPIQEN